MRYTRPLVIVSVAAVFFSLPVIFYGFPVLGHDGPVHLLYVREFSAQFWSGELYPRWLLGAHHGFGSPTFFVYAPVPYWIASLITPFARWLPPRPPAYVELGLSVLLALGLSGIAAYFWLRRFCAETAAIAGAAVYMGSPYHLVVDLYMRAALAEFWSFVWMPLVLYFTDGVLRRERRALAGVAVSYGILVMTHLLATVMFSPVPIAYALFLSRRGERLGGLARVGAGLLLGVGLASIYLLPALEHKPYLSSAKYLLAPIYQWRRNFPPLDARLFEVAGSWPSFVQFLALLMIVFAVAVVCFAWMARGTAGTFWVAVAVASLFMMLPLSAPVWRLVPLLAQLQHPWRFQTVVTVAVAALAALSFAGRPSKIAAGGLCSLALFSLGCFGYMAYRISGQDRGVAWTGAFSNDPYLSDRTSAGLTEAPMEPVRFETGAGSARIERWAPRDIRLRLRCEQECALLVRQLYYPGWKADAGARVEISERGLIRVRAAAGDRELRLWLDGGRMEQIGRWVSAISFGVLLLSLPVKS